MNYRGVIGIGAHNTAADVEFHGWGSLAGQAEYQLPKLGMNDFDLMQQRKRNYLRNGTY